MKKIFGQTAIILVVLFINQSILKAQVDAGFQASPSSGCSPLLVHFVADMPNADSYLWDFGNGNISAQSNPANTYNNGGVYTVQLIVVKNSDSDTSTQTIIVYNNPVAGFSVVGATEGCTTFNVDFQNNSSWTDGQIVEYYWSFGNGNVYYSGTANNASTSYFYEGVYSVALSVEDVHGCTDNIEMTNLITVHQSPHASFIGIPVVGCQVPMDVVFTNNSTGAGPMLFSWDFGNGSTSSQANPTNTYSSFGNFSVSLVVTDVNACTAQKEYIDYVLIHPVQVDFSFPDTVCFNQGYAAQNFSTGGNISQWEYGSQSNSNFSPTLTFSQPGNVLLSLTVSLNGQCATTVSQNVFVDHTIADFTMDPDPICDIPIEVQFQNQSYSNNTSGPVQYNWSIEDYGSTNAIDTSITFVYDPVDLFVKYHSYSVVLSAQSDFGCTNIRVDSVYFFFPDTCFQNSENSGCIPFEYYIENCTEYNHPSDSIISWNWDFGNGDSSMLYSPGVYTYVDTGIFNISAVATTQAGCEFTFDDEVYVGDIQNPVPIASFPDTLCASDYVSIGNQSTQVPYLDYQNIFVFEPDSELFFYYPPFPYNDSSIETLFLDTGYQSVYYTVAQYGCWAPLASVGSVYTLGPVIQGAKSLNCNFPDTYLFSLDQSVTDNFIEVDSFYWDFGDGSAFYSSSTSVTHTYQITPAYYNVALKAFNFTTGCDYTSTMIVNPCNPDPVIVADTTIICAGDTVFFDPMLSSQYDTSYFMFFKGFFDWNFDDGKTYTYIPDTIFRTDTLTYGAIAHIFTEPGTYNVRMRIITFNGCFAETYKAIHVFRPDPVIVPQPQVACEPYEFYLLNLTQPDTPIVSWVWDFNNGQTSNDMQPDTIQYSNPGTYYPIVHTEDVLGCQSSAAIELVASDPVAAFDVVTPFLCLSDSLLLLNTSITYTDDPDFNWTFGDGTVDSTFDGIHFYNTPGTYGLGLYLNDGGCVDSLFLADTIVVIPDTFSILPDYDNTSCTPVIANFTTSLPENDFNYSWSIDGYISSDHEAGYFFNTAGVHTISLTINTSTGCILSDTFKIELYSASLDLDLSDNSICLGENIIFTVSDTDNIEGFWIDFGDGQGVQDLMVVDHDYLIAPINGNLYPSVYYWSHDSLCLGVLADSIFILNVGGDFSRGLNDADSLVCEDENIQFFGTPINANEYFYDFDDGIYSYALNPEHVFSDPGIFDVVFNVYNSTYNCTVPIIKPIIVNPLPEVNVFPDTLICLGDSVWLFSSGAESYEWLNNYHQIQSDTSSLVFPEQTTWYKVLGVDTNTCKNIDSALVEVAGNPVINLVDTFIIIGEEYNLEGEAQEFVQYNWTPFENLLNPYSYNPVFTPDSAQYFFVEASSWAGNQLCMALVDSFLIDVIYQFSADVPNAFTPNGDQINDVLFVDGSGIKQLLEFRIYNRWGQEVFFSDDLLMGWNGRYRGMDQPVDTYVYTLKVLTLQDIVLSKTGSFMLLR